MECRRDVPSANSNRHTSGPFSARQGKCMQRISEAGGGAGFAHYGCKNSNQRDQMKFCRGRDGLVLVRFARPSKRKQGQISRQIFKQLVAPHATPCLNAKCWMIRFIPFEYDRILLPSCTSNLQISHNLRRRVRKYRNN